jgi:L-fuculose-phosphate aldolase
MTIALVDPLLREITHFSALAVHKGVAAGPGGNTSVRDGDVMWISPSGVALDDIGSEQWSAVDIATGVSLKSAVRLSSEFLMHLAIYQERSDVRAVMHTHPTYTIAVISAGEDSIPYMFPDHVAIVGNLRSLDYVVPCTPQLADAVRAGISDPSLSGLLLRNHGLITVGSTMKEAWFRTEITEEAAKIYAIARSIGTPRVLSAEECREILDLEAEKYRQAVLRNPNGSVAG